MNAAPHAQVKKVFLGAAGLPEEQRESFLQQACQGNASLRRDVDSLLAHHLSQTVLASQPMAGGDQPSPLAQGDADRSVIGCNAESLFDTHVVLADLWEENRQILRRRLLIIAVIMGALMSISFVRLFTYNLAVWGYVGRAVCLSVDLAIVAVLSRKRDVSLVHLRWIEVLGMVNVGLLVTIIDVRMMFEQAGLGDAPTLISVSNWYYFTWSLLILIYGIFMPNTWQRASAILMTAACIPYLVTFLTDRWDPRVSVLLDEDDFGMPIPVTFVAAMVSIYAAHIIHGARLAASQHQRLAQYRLTKLIGVGGMGQVYEAEHVLLKRKCAIKVIQPERSLDPQALRRFEREVQATAKLTHPHTIEVYDYGQNKEGVFFCAMELLPGMNLRELVKESGPLPLGRVVHFLRQACGALTEAHASGLIHRDIKPSNIFASQRGGIQDFTKLLDFGIVRETTLPSGAELTAANAVTGTPHYMSPEQVLKPLEVDARSDLYSLGCVAYFLLTGKTPFTGASSMEVMLAHTNQTAPAVKTYREHVPADLESVVMQCLQKDPADRFQSASEMEQALSQCACASEWTQADAKAWWNDRSCRDSATGEAIENED